MLAIGGRCDLPNEATRWLLWCPLVTGVWSGTSPQILSASTADPVVHDREESEDVHGSPAHPLLLWRPTAPWIAPGPAPGVATLLRRLTRTAANNAKP